MSKYKVIVTDDRFDTYEPEKKVLAEADAELVVFDCKNQKEVQEAVKDADGVLLNLHLIGKDEIAAMQKCKVISRYGIGYNNVDVDAATKAGIWVSRVPEYGANETVSDLAMALLLDLVRKTTFKDRDIRDGKWNLTGSYVTHMIKGSVLGIIGYGNIGSVMHRKMKGFEPAEVLVYDPHKDESYINSTGAKKVDLETLLKQSDMISIHCVENEETKDMINTAQFEMMKSSAILINTARSGPVNTDALYEALKSKKIDSAGFDVFEKDPLPMDSPLRELDNFLISDHNGYYSIESIKTLKERTARNVAEVLKGNKPVYPLNEV